MPIDGLKTFLFAPGRREKIAKTCITVLWNPFADANAPARKGVADVGSGYEGAGLIILSYRC